MTATEHQPATPAEPRKRVADAKRRLFAHIIASAHLLDKPFTNAPDQSPWTQMKRAMEGLNAALAELDAAPRQPATPALPPEHQHGVDPDWCGYLAGKAAEALRQIGHGGLAEHVEHLEHAHAGGNPQHLYGDAAPRRYELPAEPAGPLWYPDGSRLDRMPPPPGYTTHTWTRDGQGWSAGLTWRELLGAANAALLTTPPTTEGATT
jgi:hypothetical protein